MAIGTPIDFDDNDPLKLVEDAYSQSRSNQQVRLNQYKRDYELFSSYIDISRRDPDVSNIFIPKIFSIIRTKVPKEIKALFGMRPWLPVESKRPEFQDISKLQTEYLDDLMNRAGALPEMVSLSTMKMTYGIGYIESLPFFEMTKEKRMVMGPMGPQLTEEEVPRFRLRVRSYAPWEVFVDPMAINLRDHDGCRYVIIFQVVSKRELIRLAQQGAYPNLDVESLKASVTSTGGHPLADDWGQQMLSDQGLNELSDDGDLGVLMRYMSPDRYIDVWNGQEVLRDTPNPFKHKKINLSRCVHSLDAHSRNKFYGLGEAKTNELLQHLLNDTYDMTFDNHQQMNQGMFAYRKGSLHPDSLVRTPGNRIAIKETGDRPISDSIIEMPGTGLPSDHYKLPEIVEGYMDLAAQSFEVARGETTGGSETLGEIGFLRQAGEEAQELTLRLWEDCLSDFTCKTFHTVDQFSTIDDWAEVLGEEAAMQMQFANPADLPGGYNFTFKGSDRVVNQLSRQRNLQQLTPIVQGTVWPGYWTKILLEAHDLGDEVDRAVIPDEVMQQMQQDQAMQEENKQREGQAREDEQGQVSHDRDMQKLQLKENTGPQMAQEQGREVVGGVR